MVVVGGERLHISSKLYRVFLAYMTALAKPSLPRWLCWIRTIEFGGNFREQILNMCSWNYKLDLKSHWVQVRFFTVMTSIFVPLSSCWSSWCPNGQCMLGVGLPGTRQPARWSDVLSIRHLWAASLSTRCLTVSSNGFCQERKHLQFAPEHRKLLQVVLPVKVVCSGFVGFCMWHSV